MPFELFFSSNSNRHLCRNRIHLVRELSVGPRSAERFGSPRLPGMSSESAEDAVRRQRKLMSDQDQALEGIEQSLGALKHVSAAISNEADLQTSLLESLDRDVENGSSAIEQQTDVIVVVSRQSSTCWLWIVVLVEVAVLVLLLSLKA